MLKRILLALCFVTILSVPFLSKMVSANTEINDKGAEQLKEIFTDLIDTQKTAVELQGHKFILDGDITVEQAEEYYAVTLPAMTFQAPDNSKVEMGLIAINASPTEQKNEWKMSVSLPTPFLITGPKGEQLKLNIGKQKAGGIWNDKLETFSSMAAIYDNLSLTNTEGQELMRVDRIISQSKYEESKDDLWSGFGKFTAQNLTIGNEKTPVHISIGSISGNADTGDFDAKTFNPIQDSLLNKLQKIQQLEETEETKGKNAVAIHKETKEFFLSAFSTLFNSFDKSAITLSLQDMQVNKLNKRTAQKETVKMGSMLLNFGIDGITNRDNANALLSFSYGGLEIFPEKPDSTFIPSKFKTQLALNNIPVYELAEIITTPKDPVKDPQAKMARKAKLKNILTEAGTNIATEDSYIGSDQYYAQIKGKLQAQSTAAQGVVGDMTVTTKDIENLMGYLQKHMANLPPQQQIQSQKVIAALAFLHAFSLPEADGKVARFALNEQGNITVNGNDISAVIGANVQPSQGE